MNYSNDLFMLMFNLSQMRDKSTIIIHFQDSISEIFHPQQFFFAEQKPNDYTYLEEITARNISFGYIFSNKKPGDEVRQLVQNAIQMLAVILDRLNFEKELIIKADSFETIAQQRLSEINIQIEELRASKFASLNLIEDLRQEIAERKQAEKALLLKNIVFDASLAANSIADNDGLITEMNDAFLRIWGYSGKQEVICKPISEFIYNPDDAEKIVLALLERGEWEGDYTAKKKDGSTFIAYSIATVIKDENGSSIGYQSAVLDITEETRVKEEIIKLNEELEQKVIQRTAQLESANKELEAFSYSVSHDLRAPLRHISGFVELLEKNFHDSLPEKGKHYLETISGSTHQMGELIDDLLQFSRTGRQEMKQSDLDMNIVVHEAQENLKEETRERKIQWNIAKLPHVYGDHALLRLVWLNLLSNAVKFTRNKEQATIKIGIQSENSEFVFFVTDNGAGFDMQYSEKLFGVFQRLHSSAEFEGTGIGLANVRRIILKHGGRTWAEAEVGKGATFYFSLPIHPSSV